MVVESCGKAIEINTVINILMIIEDNDDKAEHEDKDISKNIGPPSTFPDWAKVIFGQADWKG